MVYAMRINYVDVIVDNSLKNVIVNGQKMGYSFDIRLSYYRGHYLSVIDELGVKVDGRQVPGQDIRFCLHGKEFGIAQLHDQVGEFWLIDEPATIKVLKKGGLEPGRHEIGLKLMLHSPYLPLEGTGVTEKGPRYMPVDSCGSKVLELPAY